jgi:hypothetical protein
MSNLWTLDKQQLSTYTSYEFRRNRLISDHISCIHQILEERRGYSGTIHKLFADFNKACVSVGRDLVCSIMTALGILVKLSRVGGRKISGLL